VVEVHAGQRNSRFVKRDPHNRDAHLRLCPL
jgi:hypothetical protein